MKLNCSILQIKLEEKKGLVDAQVVVVGVDRHELNDQNVQVRLRQAHLLQAVVRHLAHRHHHHHHQIVAIKFTNIV